MEYNKIISKSLPKINYKIDIYNTFLRSTE